LPECYRNEKKVFVCEEEVFVCGIERIFHPAPQSRVGGVERVFHAEAESGDRCGQPEEEVCVCEKGFVCEKD